MKCEHPPENVTWDFKGPGPTVTIIDGYIHGTCDLCNNRVAIQATFDN
jgi:hypothetical protein